MAELIRKNTADGAKLQDDVDRLDPRRAIFDDGYRQAVEAAAPGGDGNVVPLNGRP